MQIVSNLQLFFVQNTEIVQKDKKGVYKSKNRCYNRIMSGLRKADRSIILKY